MLNELYSINITEDTIIEAEKAAAIVCEEVLVEIEENIRENAVKHCDETGIRVAGKLHWMHNTSNENWTKYSVSAKRGEVMTNLTGTLVRDCFKQYDKYNPDAKHALCNAHILRELKAVEELDREPWAHDMQKILLLMNDLKHRYKKYENPIPQKLIYLAIERYDTILVGGSKYQNHHQKIICSRKGKSRALLARLLNRKWDVIRFFTEDQVPFTNNLAERDLRMNKVKQKISGCFRKLEGARRFAAIRSVTSSLQKQGANIFAGLKQIFQHQSISFPLLWSKSSMMMGG